MEEVDECTRFWMLLFNLLFFGCGCLILGVSVWMRETKFSPELFEIPDQVNIDHSGRLLIVVGSIIVAFGLLGCCGAFMESQCMLLLHFFGLLLILVFLIVALIFGVKYKNKVEQEIFENMQKKVDLLKTNATFQVQMREFEKQNKCCAINGEFDWKGTSIQDGCTCLVTDFGILGCPMHLKKYTKALMKKKMPSPFALQMPCSKAVLDSFRNLMNTIGVIILGLAGLVSVCLVTSLFLYFEIEHKSIPKKEKTTEKKISPEQK